MIYLGNGKSISIGPVVRSGDQIITSNILMVYQDHSDKNHFLFLDYEEAEIIASELLEAVKMSKSQDIVDEEGEDE